MIDRTITCDLRFIFNVKGETPADPSKYEEVARQIAEHLKSFGDCISDVTPIYDPDTNQVLFKVFDKEVEE